MSACAECRYFRDADNEAGLCRRYAPRPALFADGDDGAEIAVWPIVAEDEWCGDWAARQCQ